jgi:hypothetical protein
MKFSVAQAVANTDPKVRSSGRVENALFEPSPFLSKK